MSYLLRVRLPDVPGSLGRLATAVGEAGGNIDAIEIVSRDDGFAVDDVFLAAERDVMPDSIVSACQQLDGVSVLWVSRYAAGGNIVFDLEAVEAMSDEPERAADTLVDLAPRVFRVDWALRASRSDGQYAVLHRTSAAPAEIPADLEWPAGDLAQSAIGDLIVAGARLHDDDAVMLGRRGGPVFLDSELARLRHLVALAAGITR